MVGYEAFLDPCSGVSDLGSTVPKATLKEFNMSKLNRCHISTLIRISLVMKDGSFVIGLSSTCLSFVVKANII